MARQRIQFDPSSKEFEAYLDFSGGHNSEVSNERLNNNEFPLMLNVDNSGRGSAKTRSGRIEQNSPGMAAGGVGTNGQGLFNFYRSDQVNPDLIFAVGGSLWVWRRGQADVQRLPIRDDATNNNDFTFQNALPVEAAQYQSNLFVATGTKLVEVSFDGGTYKAKTVVPYQPTAMEAIHIGTNALAPNPDTYIQDGVAAGQSVEVVGIKPQYRTGAANEPITFTAYISRPSGYAGEVEYKWSYKKTSETAWKTHKDWTAGEKATTITFSEATKHDIKVVVRKQGESTAEDQLKSYTLASYMINATPDKPAMPVTGINRCRKIILHWDRLLMSGDDVHPYQMYISDLQNPRYFPVSNTISFDFGKQEPITAVVRFQDMLVVFTRTTIQTLYGKSVDDYKRFLIHDGIGCVADRSVTVVGNNVVFLSQDGIYGLRPNIYRLETMNVVRIDQNIQSEVDVTQMDACGIVHDSQYWICFPQKKRIYRYYFERKTWVRDESSKLNIVQFLMSANEIYNLTKDGRLYRHDRNTYTDAGASYNMIIESKFYDLSASFNNKKLKRIYLLAKHFKEYDVDMFVTVKADSAAVLSPEQGQIVKDNVDGWYWRVTLVPNFAFLRGTTFGKWVLGESPFGDTELSVQRASIRGKCRRVKVKVEIPSSTPAELYGFGLEFKMKKI